MVFKGHFFLDRHFSQASGSNLRKDSRSETIVKETLTCDYNQLVRSELLITSERYQDPWSYLYSTTREELCLRRGLQDSSLNTPRRGVDGTARNWEKDRPRV